MINQLQGPSTAEIHASPFPPMWKQLPFFNVIGQRSRFFQRKSPLKGPKNMILRRIAGLKVLANALSLITSVCHVSWLKGIQLDIAIIGRMGAWQLGEFPIKARDSCAIHLPLKSLRQVGVRCFRIGNQRFVRRTCRNQRWRRRSWLFYFQMRKERSRPFLHCNTGGIG